MTLTCIVSFLFRFSFKGLGIQKWRFVETKDIYKFLVVLPVGAPHIFKKKPKFLKPILSRKRQAGFPVWPFGAISPWSTWSTWSIWSILLKSCHSIRVHCPFIFATTFCVKERCTESGTTINWGSMHHTIKAKYFLWTKLLSNFSMSRSKNQLCIFIRYYLISLEKNSFCVVLSPLINRDCGNLQNWSNFHL